MARVISDTDFEKLKEAIDTAMLRFSLLANNRNTEVVSPDVGHNELVQAWRVLQALPTKPPVAEPLGEDELRVVINTILQHASETVFRALVNSKHLTLKG